MSREALPANRHWRRPLRRMAHFNWLRVMLICWALTSREVKSEKSALCSFEHSECADEWTFVNSEQLHQQHQIAFILPSANSTSEPHQADNVAEKENNFRIVLSGGGNASNHYAYYQAMVPSSSSSSSKAQNGGSSPVAVPMLVSAVFFERTSPRCELHFRYRVLGIRGAELLVATEQLSLRLLHPDALTPTMMEEEEEDEDWTRPTLRARFEPASPPLGARDPWAQARVPLGQFSFPTRIRVECHPSSNNNEAHNTNGRGDEEEEEEEEPTLLNVECSVDDLQLVNCAEERWMAAGSAEGGADCPAGRIPCRPFGREQRQICLRDDQLCDMHPDCADGEDELEQLHRCSQVPEGARCDFEDLRWLPAGCANWRFFSSQAGGQPNNSSAASQNGDSTGRGGGQTLQHLVSLADAQTRRAGIPPGEYQLDGRIYRPGHFLFFSSYDHTQSSQHDIVYSFALSPPLPSFQQPSQLVEGVHQRQCSLRFFYCQTGFSPFQVFLQRRDQPQELAKPLWAPPRDEHVREPCEWHRAAVHIDTAQLALGGKYSLKLSFAKLAGSLGSIAVDDLSLSPECFAANGHNTLLPPKLSISVDDLSETANVVEKHPGEQEGSIHNQRRWIVPSSGEYRLVLTGAAGGTLPSSKQAGHRRRDTWADRLVANVHLRAGQQIGVLLGHRGECICDQAKAQLSNRREHVEMFETLCANSSSSVTSLDPLTLPGCSGGGASFFHVGNKPVFVAAGGGGDFHTRSIVIDAYKQTPVLAGSGFSLTDFVEGNVKQQCINSSSDDPTCIDGHAESLNLSRILGGKCPPVMAQSRTGWSFVLAGGIGGGGAVCGAGWSAGGGGFRGGTAAFLAPGLAGSSGLLEVAKASASSTLVRESGDMLIVGRQHWGQGSVQLLACPQRLCPPRANCTFGSPQQQDSEAEPSPKCICPGGHTVPLNGSCQHFESSLLDKLFGSSTILNQQHKNDVPNLLLLACFLLALLSVLFCLLCCLQLVRCVRRRQKLQTGDVHELMAIEAGGQQATGERGGGTTLQQHVAGISGNPIYESLSLNPLSQIPRIIGHGAFGEVFEGWLHTADQNQGQGQHQQAIKVAVKSLPVESARDFGDDFEMEARLLSQFKHENIVAFFGVSFEQQPKYIVLEFLEGGDLKNFLRENRPKQVQESTLRMGDLFGFALDVARGAEHLEATRFVHRDIAARNCLLTAKVGRRMVKIADFGMARDIYRNDYYRKGGKAFLPVRWMPPESFLDGLFTSKTDVWAFGVLLWEIFSMGYIPYSGRENHEVMRLVCAGDRLDPPIGIPAEVYELMLCCWHTEAERRPKFAELICTFEALMKREDLCAEPLPPIRHRLANERSVSATPSMSRADPASTTSQVSQGTISTVLSSSAAEAAAAGGGSSSTTSTYDSMPTAGDGVCRAVFPPYQSRQPDENGLIRLGRSADHHDDGEDAGEDGASGSNSSDSQDETLHESAGTVKLRSCIARKPPPPLTLRPMQGKEGTFMVAAAVQQPTSSSTTKTDGIGRTTTAAGPSAQSQANASGAQQWRRPSIPPTATASSACCPPTTPQYHQQQQQQHRNHSLPPFGYDPPSPHCQSDYDSGIASARSIASSDAALLTLTSPGANLLERRTTTAGCSER